MVKTEACCLRNEQVIKKMIFFTLEFGPRADCVKSCRCQLSGNVLLMSVALSLCIVAMATITVGAQVPVDEMTALYELFHNTSGAAWQWRPFFRGSRWNFSRNINGDFIENPCSSEWQGVNCSKSAHLCASQACRITSISLPRYNLTGIIPPKLGSLLELKSLSLDNNFLFGTIPLELGDLVELELLNLGYNNLTGNIPPNLGNLSLLENLYMGHNSLYGNIPPEMAGLVGLKRFVVDDNALTGTIPSEIGMLDPLEMLYCDYNTLTGPIPEEIGNLLMLEQLDLKENLLTGSIPLQLSKLVRLQLLYLDFNALSGSIPPELSNLEELQYLSLNDNALNGFIFSEIGHLLSLERLFLAVNFLTGSIPSEISNLVFLERLGLDNNMLGGPIPHSIGHLEMLQRCDLDHNLLTGSIPSAVGNLVMLDRLDVDKNALSGSIPPELCEAFLLYRLDFDSNFLTGSIPPEIGRLVLLERLDLHNNALTGILPPEIGHAVLLSWVDVNSNALTGSIPSEIGNLQALESFDLHLNVLTGPLPSEVGTLVMLQRLHLGDNTLSGSIPKSVGNLTNLFSLLLQRNVLMGRIGDALNPYVLRALKDVDVSDNLLSGPLDNIFLFPALSVLALSVNCFQEELPDAMCNAATIEVLSLNGLGAAEGCANTVKFPLSGVSMFNSIGGTLPECVWHLPNLTTLHLTGNGLIGSIISRIPIYSAIADLSLSHNQFSGTIPLNVQRIRSVDLSHNQFSGKYEDIVEVWHNQFIDLEINRLSGHLSVSKLENETEVNILRGNMFSCDSIPANDEFSDDYICGSEDLNESLVVFASALIVTCVTALAVGLAAVSTEQAPRSRSGILLSFTSKIKGLLCEYKSAINQARVTANVDLQPIATLCDNLENTMFLFVKLFVVILTVGSPLYVARGADGDATFSTHTNTYSWFWTLAYLHGVVPSCLILMSWFVAVAACYYFIILAPTVKDSPAVLKLQPLSVRRGHTYTSYELKHEKTEFYWVWASILLNGAGMIAVNSSYIYATQQSLSTSILFGMQISLAVFRLLYSKCIIPLLARPILDPVANIIFRLRLLIMNNLIMPCAATALTSPSCFQGLIVEADAVRSPYAYEECSAVLITEVGEVCIERVTVEVETGAAIPPFIYNNQCASVLLTSYIPVLVLGYSIQLVLTFLLPVMLHRTEKWSRMKGVTHGIICPDFWRNTSPEAVCRTRNTLESDPSIILNSEVILCFDVVNNLLTLLTFGLCSPVLAIAVTCSVASKMMVLMLLVGRFTSALIRGHGGGEHHFALLALAKIHFPVRGVLQQAFWQIVCISALFFTLICWDMAWDEVGWLESIWIPVVTLCCPAVLWVMDWLLQGRRQKPTSVTEISSTAGDILIEGNAEKVKELELTPSPMIGETRNPML